jgi:hypothetical protein
MEVLSNIPFAIDLGVLRDRVRVDPQSEEAADLKALVAQVQPIARPKAVYDLCFIEAREADTVQLNGVAFHSRVLSVNLQEVHRAFPYVATCGTELYQVDTGGDPLKEYWLDQIRMLAVAHAAGYVKEHVERTYQPGQLSRMSPGSLPDWPISQQTPLFTLLGDVEGSIGVQLTDSFLMLPLKSVSGLLFPTDASFASCQLCPREDCPGRHAPYDAELWQKRYAGEG